MADCRVVGLLAEENKLHSLRTALSAVMFLSCFVTSMLMLIKVKMNVRVCQLLLLRAVVGQEVGLAATVEPSVVSTAVVFS